MTSESKEALLGLVVPDLHLVVISTTYEQRLGLVEIHAPNRP